MAKQEYDVCVIGGGPSGTTCGTLLRKYDPSLRVLILEREKFPREHVGESQLPPVCHVLDEMGCWEKVEAADFPIKIGVTYRWGIMSDLWDFDFLAGEPFKESPRPAKFKGQRKQTAFQVERAIYDDILLRHAAECGCEVRERAKVVEVSREGDRVTGLRTESGETITARYYVDATGTSAILRRAMGIEVDAPPALRNIAIWDYWDNAEWAVTVGIGGTRVIVLSLGYGWVWFIPIGPSRASIGLVTAAEYYRGTGLSPDAIYAKALEDEPTVRKLIRNAKREGQVRTTKDWSYLADRMAGENWFLAGESAGFADPILAAGLTLSQTGAREVAYTILALDANEHDPEWLKCAYEDNQKQRIGQHIRFANFWYTANGQFRDLQEYTTEIAKDAGLELEPERAFMWLGTGGFTHDNPALASLGVFSLGAVKAFTEMFLGGKGEWEINKYNTFSINLRGAEQDTIPVYEDGKVRAVKCYRRDAKALPAHGLYKLLIDVLLHTDRAQYILVNLRKYFEDKRSYSNPEEGVAHALEVLESMVRQGWVIGKSQGKHPNLEFTIRKDHGGIRWTTDLDAPLPAANEP